MTMYVAFLRGINVGGRIIKMADLKACFEKAGFGDVSTLLQSGNVIFESDDYNLKALKQNIESALTVMFNYPAKAQVYTVNTLNKLVSAYPFVETNHDFQYYIVFLEDNLAQGLVDEAGNLDSINEAIQLGTGVVYWRVKKGMTLKSPFSKYLTKPKYKDFNTTRNTKTLRKIITQSQVL